MQLYHVHPCMHLLLAPPTFVTRAELCLWSALVGTQTHHGKEKSRSWSHNKDKRIKVLM